MFSSQVSFLELPGTKPTREDQTNQQADNVSILCVIPVGNPGGAASFPDGLPLSPGMMGAVCK